MLARTMLDLRTDPFAHWSVVHSIIESEVKKEYDVSIRRGERETRLR
jgi:hypothetical protein